MHRNPDRRFRPTIVRLESLRLLTGFSPIQIAHAYGLDSPALANQLQGAALGAGQTIAIVDAYHDPYLLSDLKAFNTAYNLPTADITQVYNSRTPTNDIWAEEEALDVEWVHAIAPGAKIVVVEAASSSLTDLVSAIDTARSTVGVSVVAMSWGAREFLGQTAMDTHFTTPTGHTGVTFLAATGDNSAAAGASWPASSANVVAVGGTTLNLISGSVYGSESAWSLGGGGVSRYVTIPSYQVGVQSRTMRTTPDVSIDADPRTGYSIVYTPPSTGRTSTITVGGTSASVQVWAALIGITDQARALVGKATLDGPSQTLPALYSLASADFHDVTTGSNGYAAGNGYDLATGRGTPYVASVIRDLTAYGTATALKTVSNPVSIPATTPASTPTRYWYWGWSSNYLVTVNDPTPARPASPPRKLPASAPPASPLLATVLETPTSHSKDRRANDLHDHALAHLTPMA